ncbi:unnamed protein product [Clonostachys rosea]|uniref:NADPH--cytochrome P450 reductase n=1 Tax=Bionectria ochroleuca TaxID=29856 RepID=A0ABY6U690_BIOOC|nr:unnamed protein product [Clonostachys rosea]
MSIVFASALGILLLFLFKAQPLLYSRLAQFGGERQTVLESGQGKTSRDSNPKCIVQKIQELGINFVVFYGSQTGNAHQFAEQLAKEGRTRFGLETLAADLEEYDYARLSRFPKEGTAVFILSSYGEGEPTDNAAPFFSFITEDPAFADTEQLDDPLQSMTYAAFGLGNSTYEHYNAVVRKVDAALETLGARRVVHVGEGDDGLGTVEDSFITWKESLWQSLRELRGLEQRDTKFEPSFVVTPYSSVRQGHEGDDFSLLELSKAQNDPTGTQMWRSVQVKKSEELFTSSDRYCTHMELDIQGTGLSYVTGDHVSIWPINADVEVERFLRVFGLWEQRHTRIKISAIHSTERIPIPATTTYDTAARHLLDIAGPVSRQSISIFVQYLTHETQKLSLLKMASDSGYFHDAVSSKLLNIAQLIEITSQAGQVCPIPFAILLECVKPLQPRHYSISSSSLVQRDTVSLTVVANPIHFPARHFHGVASNFLLAVKRHGNGEKASLNEPSYDLTKVKTGTSLSLAVQIRRSNFRLPQDSAWPVIMIGAGTGIAPFRAFIQERCAQAQSGISIGKSILFYGCRKESEDFIYGTEWKAAQKILGDQFKLFTAFSRQAREKEYVQHLLSKYASEVLPLLLTQNAYLYICGDTHMAREVQHTLQELITSESQTNGELFLKNAREFGRFQEDVW